MGKNLTQHFKAACINVFTRVDLVVCNCSISEERYTQGPPDPKGEAGEQINKCLSERKAM